MEWEVSGDIWKIRGHLEDQGVSVTGRSGA